MPIANCFCKKKNLSKEKLEEMVLEWSRIIGVNKKEVCINIINEYTQVGQKYSVFINLYLPTIWSKTNIKKIQLGLLKVISKYYNIEESEVFIVTSVVQSEHVIENGKIVKW